MDRRAAVRHPQHEFAIRIGLPVIDREHVALVRQLDDLAANSAAYPGSDAFSEVLSGMGRQINAHFDKEEEILHACGMPPEAVQEHIRSHTEILEQYARLNLDMMAGKHHSREDALAMVRRWIVGHVLSHDVKMASYLSVMQAELMPAGRDGRDASPE